MSDDGTAYTYSNIGIYLDPNDDDVFGYVYVSIGFVGARSYIGKVVGFAARPLIHTAALMQNLGILLIPGKDGIAVVTTNVIDYVFGADRLLEDGTDRLDEDGITTRITE